MNGHLNIGDIKPTYYFFSIAIVLGLLFAMTSNDSEKHYLVVFLQWQLQTVIPMALLIATHRQLLSIDRFSVLNPWISLLVSGFIGASLFTPIALTVDLWLETPPQNQNYLIEIWDEWIGVAPPIAISWVTLNVPWLLGYRLEKPHLLTSL